MTGDGKEQVRLIELKDRGEVPRLELERGRFVEPAVADVLCRAAKKGGMTRIQMDDDKRWRWVCREVADRNDRSVPKE